MWHLQCHYCLSIFRELLDIWNLELDLTGNQLEILKLFQEFWGQDTYHICIGVLVYIIY